MDFSTVVSSSSVYVCVSLSIWLQQWCQILGLACQLHHISITTLSANTQFCPNHAAVIYTPQKLTAAMFLAF